MHADGRHFAHSSLLALARAAIFLGLPGCEPAVPPAGPENAATADVAPPAPPPPAADQDAPREDETRYASPEYTVGENADAYDDNDPAALTDFRATLDPYGAWADDRTYGTVWVPSSNAVGPDFVPYATAGHWAYDDDWVWMSDYPWGWAPFHYGRWVFIEGRGWSWIPGRVYRGAWVTWGFDDGYTYLGWAPLGPEFVWFGGYAVGFGVYVGPRWVYCPRAEIFSPAVGGRIVAGPAAAPIAARMHTFVPAAPGVGGPQPQRMGFAPSQIPHGAGATAQSLARAQAFARPSTAQAVGARPPTRVVMPASGAQSRGAAPTYTPDRPGVPSGVRSVPAPRVPASPQAPVVRAPANAPPTVHPRVSPAPPAAAHAPPPAFHPASPGGGGGGGGHHR